MPVRIEFIESPEKVASFMPELCALLSDGLIEAQDTIIYKSAARPGAIRSDALRVVLCLSLSRGGPFSTGTERRLTLDEAEQRAIENTRELLPRP